MREVEEKNNVETLQQRLQSIIKELEGIRTDLAELSSTKKAETLHTSDTSKAYESDEEDVCLIDDEVTDLPEEYQVDGALQGGEERLDQSTDGQPSQDFAVETHQKAGVATMNELFAPKASTAEDMGRLFQKSTTTFDLTRGVALADQYLFIRELFDNDSEAYRSTIEEINRMSSWAQVEHYLRHILQLSPDDETVERFFEVIKASAKK